MTPKEEANKLRYQIESAMQDADMRGHYNHAVKECVLIAVDRIQKLKCINYSNANDETQYDYCQEVKQEIEKI